MDTEKRLENIEAKIDKISETLNQIAIQRDRIDRLEERMHGIWNRYDGMIAPDGIVSKVRQHQASCPREQIRWLWVVIIPMGMTLLGMGYAMLRCIP